MLHRGAASARPASLPGTMPLARRRSRPRRQRVARLPQGRRSADHVQAAVAQRIDRRARLGKRRIIKRDHGANPLVPTDIDHRMTTRLQRPPAFARAPAQATSPSRASKHCCQQPPLSRRRPPIPRPGTSRTSRAITGSMPRSGRRVDGAGRAMFGMALQTRQPAPSTSASADAVAVDGDDPCSA